MNTANLSLPLIAAAQAAKHVTHNEALLALDAVTQLSVVSRVRAIPAAPEQDLRWIVPDGATAAWAGRSGCVAMA